MPNAVIPKDERALVVDGRAVRRARLGKLTVAKRERITSWVLPALCLLLGCREPKAEARQAEAKPQASVEQPAAAPSAAPPALPRNVVLLTIDTLRGDLPFTTGAPNTSTPNLARLASQCITYERAYSLANFTTASLNGLLSSRYPSELERSSCHLGKYEIPDSLAPRLSEAGIVTFAAHGHAIFTGDAAPRRGFAVWRLIKGVAGRMQTRGAVTGAETAALLTSYWENERPAKPLFAWLHLLDPHHSYVAHPDFPPRSNAPRDRYESEVAYTDSLIGKVFDSIERSGAMGSTAIIVTSDHGEAFGEHGTIYHGSSLFEEEMRVPLMLCLPGAQARRISAPRSTLDLAPTIAELLGVPAGPAWRGKSLLPDLRGTPESRPVLIDVPPTPGFPARQAAIYDKLKVMLGPGPAQVFDLGSDPLERTPLRDATDHVSRAQRDLGTIRSVRGSPCLEPGSPDSD